MKLCFFGRRSWANEGLAGWTLDSLPTGRVNINYKIQMACRFTNGSRSLGLVGFAASPNKADARHYDLPYLYNPQQVAAVLIAIQLKIVISWSCLQLRPQADNLPNM